MAGDAWEPWRPWYTQKIRPARAPKGPGRPFSSERGTAGPLLAEAKDSLAEELQAARGDPQVLKKQVHRAEQSVAKHGFARLKKPPREPSQPIAQPWPFFFLATFLAAFFFFFAIAMAPCHEHPHTSHDRSPGCSGGGNDRRFASPFHVVSNDFHRCKRPLHGVTIVVVQDDAENCQEIFGKIFGIFPCVN
jgi:hypothetical protein